MEFPPYKNNLAFSLKHERFLCDCKVNEINFNYLLFELIGLGLFLIYFYFIALVFRLLIVLLGIVVSFPFLVKRWHLDLTNKRLVVRRWFFGLERFFTWSSIKLSMIETLQTSPRIKVVPLLTGYWLLTSYALPLLEFGTGGEIPLPFFLKLLVFLGYYSSNIQQVEESLVKAFIEPIFRVFGNIAIIAGFGFLVIGSLLFVWGLPYRQEFRVRTVSGHEFSLRTGLPKYFILLLNSILRKHHVFGEFENELEFPKLVDEELKAKGRLGLIDRNSQIIGILSLLIFMRGASNLILKIHLNDIKGVLSLLLNLIDLVFIIFLIIFAKRYQKIWTTNHRIIFQEERKGISGLWGKRIYSYSDLPFSQVQGFKVSYFSGFSPYSLLIGILILAFSQILVSVVGLISPHVWLPALGFSVGTIYLILNYRTFGELTLFSLGGRTIRLKFRVPYLISKLSHRLEGKEGLAGKFFPNLLSDAEIQTICNAIRGINEPKRPLTKKEHFLDALSFLGNNEEILHSVEKINPHPFYWHFGIMFSVFGILAIFLGKKLFDKVGISFNVQIVILGLASIYLVTRILSFTIVVQKSLFLTNDRIIQQSATQPHKLARRLGYLPTWTLQEYSNDFVTSLRQKLLFHSPNLREVVSMVILPIIASAWWILFILSPNQLQEISFLVLPISLSLILILYALNHSFLGIMKSMPRYGVQLESRQSEIKFPYFPKPKELEQKFYIAIRNLGSRNLITKFQEEGRWN